jgi:histidinol-phosphatase (PHP family)
MNEHEPLFSSMHTHTLFCDGKDDVETMCRAAYEKKLFAIGFSAHAPVPKKTGIESNWNLKDERADEYIEEVLAAKRRWQGRLEVFLGYEVDYIKGLRSPLDSDIKALNLDYIIGSVHYIVHPNGAKPFTVDGSREEFTNGLNEAFGGDAQALMNYYYDAVTEMTVMGGFDILGHADLIKKNTLGGNFWTEESESRRQREVARAAAQTGIVAEVNTGGINRKKIHEVYPSLSFLRLFREYEVPVIITADAHRAEDINGNYEAAIQTLIYADFKEHALFYGKNNEKKLWKTEKIQYKGLD